ncbi:MAG: hypothetical protein M0R03_19540 [Novosphingobium sp.]|nr:hypothetical protein [Novosphingobium sp.]
MKITQEAEASPRFYLPCRRQFMSRKTEWYPFIYAPIVILLYIIYDISRQVWYDLIDISIQWQKLADDKKKNKG